VSVVLYRSCVAAHIEQGKHCRGVGHVQGFQCNAYAAYKGNGGIEPKDDAYWPDEAVQQPGDDLPAEVLSWPDDALV
jgi:hypothetical protein